jgi:hypothetical protein
MIFVASLVTGDPAVRSQDSAGHATCLPNEVVPLIGSQSRE